MAPVVTKRKNIQFALAKVYEGEPFTDVLWAEPKLDGLRGACIIPRNAYNANVALTRTGLPIPNAAIVLKELEQSGQFDDCVLDGEFFGDDWNESQSIVKTQELHPDRHKLNFHVFDILPVKEWNAKKSTTPLCARKADLLTRLKLSPRAAHVKYVRHTEVWDAQQARAERAIQLLDGYEGIMLKDPNAAYAFKKSRAWLKYKPFFEGDFVVTGAVEGRGKHVGRLGALQLEGPVQWKGKKVGVLSEVGTGFDDATRQQLWNDYKHEGLIGRIAEVEFQEVTEDGSLRFPSFRRMRDDK